MEDSKNSADVTRKGKFSTIFMMQAAAIVGISAFLVREIIDADTWWQVAIGRHIISTLSAPAMDLFSVAAYGRPYHDSHWLFQVFAAAADHVGGPAGVSLLMIAIWGLTFLSSYCSVRLGLSPAYGCILVFLTALACSDRFTPRPDIVTACMIALFYLRLQQGKYRTIPRLLLLVALQVIWTNAHGLFVIGPFMAGCYWLETAVNHVRKKSADLTSASVLVIALAFASLVSPYGLAGWRYAFLLATEAGPSGPSFFKGIAELTPTFGAAARSAPDFWFFLLLSAIGLVSVFAGARERRLSLSRLLIVLGMLAAACTGRRNIPLFALVVAPFISENLSSVLAGLRMPRAVALGAAGTMLLSAVFPVSGSYYKMLNYPARFGIKATPVLFSGGFSAFFRSIGFSGTIYNSNYLGGYCLYHGYLPLTDGRWETYDAGALADILSAPSDRALWERVVFRYNVKGVLLLHESNEANSLLPRLRDDAGWRLVYADSTVSFWMRSDLPGLPPQAEPLRLATELSSASRPEEAIMLGSFFSAIGYPDVGIKYLDQAQALGGRKEIILRKKAGLFTDTGRFAEAEEAWLAFAAMNEKDPASMNELAFLAYRRGDLKQAASYLKRGLALNPDDADMKANYERIRKTAGVD